MKPSSTCSPKARIIVTSAFYPRAEPVSEEQICTNHESQRPLHDPVQESPGRQSVCEFGASDVSKDVEAYKDVTREPYSYLLIDLRPEEDEDLRLLANIFPGETHYVYVPK